MFSCECGWAFFMRLCQYLTTCVTTSGEEEVGCEVTRAGMGRAGEVVEKEKKLYTRVKAMWMSPLLSRCMQAWRQHGAESKLSGVSARVLATWAGASTSTCFSSNTRPIAPSTRLLRTLPTQIETATNYYTSFHQQSCVPKRKSRNLSR